MPSAGHCPEYNSIAMHLAGGMAQEDNKATTEPETNQKMTT